MIPLFKNPQVITWTNLTARPAIETASLDETVQQIFDNISKDGDEALLKYTKLYDEVTPKSLKISAEQIKNCTELVSTELKYAIAVAYQNIRKFHLSQLDVKNVIETMPGVQCWRENRGIENVGIYIPGGSAPLFSTVLMLGIPAQIANCKNIVLCSPPNSDGEIAPAILYAAKLCGITELYCVGGIQAIAALTFGTNIIPKVDKIFGPGNQYVTAAKQQAVRFGVAVDLPAGPSELLIIADESANPAFVASDLLSQAEHGADSQVILLSDNLEIIRKVESALAIQIEALPRREIIRKALTKSKVILLKDIQQCIAFSNLYAPEHLILATKTAEFDCDAIKNAGSVFIGNYSPESAGDYASGTNHTLPTNGYAKNYSGVSVDSFVKKITFQKISAIGIQNLGPIIEVMAEAEQLDAHKNAVTIRLKSLSNV